MYGGRDIPAAGFGFGDAVIVELLRDKHLLPFDSDGGTTGAVDVLVFVQAPEFQSEAIRLSSSLRAAGVSVDLVLEQKRAKWAFKHANRVGARAVVMLAEEEMAQNKVVLKILHDSTQAIVPTDELIYRLIGAGIVPKPASPSE
jgi:histidyl-tRNA synthetase